MVELLLEVAEQDGRLGWLHKVKPCLVAVVERHKLNEDDEKHR